ncbi:MAG TPA: response regulator [Geopsychrobacteraceae bacterium]|nr:response regulator [Geopsychrobacteraceae bacterium]
MKSFFRNLPIRLKLSAAIVVVCFIVLSIIGSAFVVVEIYSFREELVDDISVIADLISTSSSSSLMSQQSLRATTILDSLHQQPHVRAAYLFDAAGTPFAQYLDRSDVEFVIAAVEKDFLEYGSAEWQITPGTRVVESLTHQGFFSPIMHQGKRIGSIYILSDNKRLYSRIFGLLLGIILAFVASVSFSLLLARFLSGQIANPLLSLVATMEKISRDNNFSVRAEKNSTDEVGVLVDGFNDMLAQIEIRNIKIADHQKYLEETVTSRTLELQETVTKLDTARRAADAANQAKSQFLANMTHELRTPLIGVLGMNELLSRTELTYQQSSLVETVQRSGEDLLAIISDILDFSKIEAGYMRLENIEVDIFDAVEDVTLLLAEKANQKGLEISCQITPSAVCKVVSDPVRIRQILHNLIGNAIKFTSEGEIIVRLDMETTGRGLGCFVFEIEDTGEGMSEEARANVLSAFVQANSTTTREHGGSGLGLSIVQQLVDLMGGTLQIESQTGSGTLVRVHLTLPVVSTQIPEIPSLLRGRRVLVYDERNSDRSAMQAILSGVGMQVFVSSSVEDAWCQLLTASRQGQPFDFAFIPAHSVLPDHSLLIRNADHEPLLSRLRIIATCCSLSGKEQRGLDEFSQFEKPVRWFGLAEALVRSWEKVGLVMPSLPDDRIEAVEQTPVAKISRKYKILVADDNKITRELVSLSLADLPLDVDFAVSGDAVLKLVESVEYDLIFMDCNMPIMDGIHATRQLRRQGCRVPIVALTAHADPQIFDSCSEAGMNGVLRKPFRQKELHDTIKKWIALEASFYVSAKENRPDLMKRDA